MTIISRDRLFPSSSRQLARTPLSILDSIVLRYAPTAGVWIFRDAPTVDLLTASLKATLNAYPQWSGQLLGLPSLIIQITTLVDNGVAIAVKFAHPLADAMTLLQFVHDWAAVSKAMRQNDPLPALSPIFDPSLIDRAAAGDIDASHPSPSVLETARPLPLHRYDCWNSKAGSPPFMQALVTIPPEFEASTEPSGPSIDWANWDYSAPVSHYLLDFTAEELHAIWNDANSFATASHLDALLAHIWSLIIRARKVDGEFHLDVTFGFRNRLDPPLGTSFLGSPLYGMKITATAQDAADHKLGPIANAIRSSLHTFNASTLPALLHELAFESSPLRLWSGFFGARNTIITSWIHEQLPMRNVDFGTGPPAYIEAVMPSTDGIVQIMELSKSGPAMKRWYEGGATVSLHLRDDVMQNLLRDPLLRQYRS
ncbi:hypothetical protein H0H93_010967 [Arthromyces matolae]|nr:hypothetical protein H0H93_010967 [Arthromyces matolae]